MKPTLEDIELILLEGADQDILALAGEDIGFQSIGDCLDIRYGEKRSRCSDLLHTPDCVRLLGTTFDFRAVAFAYAIDSDVLGLSCTERATVFDIDRDFPDDWHGHISIAGEDYGADVMMSDPPSPDWLRHLYVSGEHDFSSKLVVFRLGKNTG